MAGLNRVRRLASSPAACRRAARCCWYAVGGVVGDGGQDGVRGGVAGVAEEGEGVDEVVEAFVGLGAAHGKQEAASGGWREQRGVWRAESVVGGGEPVGQFGERGVGDVVGVLQVVAHVDGDGCDVAAAAGGGVQAVPLPVDAVGVGGVVQQRGGAGHDGDVAEGGRREQRGHAEERHVEEDHGEGAGAGQDVPGEAVGGVGGQVAEGGQAAEADHAGGAVVDRMDARAGPNEQGVGVPVPARLVFRAFRGEPDGQHDEAHAGVEECGEGVQEAVVGVAGAGAGAVEAVVHGHGQGGPAGHGRPARSWRHRRVWSRLAPVRWRQAAERRALARSGLTGARAAAGSV